MTSAFFKLCCSERCASNSSAGGQLEQPSEVNSSTTTGVRAASGVAEDACACGRIHAAAARESALRIEAANGCFIKSFSPASPFDPFAPKRFQGKEIDKAILRLTVMIALTGYWYH